LSQTPQPSSGFLIASQNIGKQLLALPNCQSTCFPPQQTGRSLKFPAAFLAFSPILPVPPELGCAPTNPCPIQSFWQGVIVVVAASRAVVAVSRPCCCGCGLNICVRPSCCCRRFGAEEDKYKSSPHIRPVTKTTLKTSTNGISSSENGTSSSSKTSSKSEESPKKTENGSSASSKTEESLKKTEEDTATSKPKKTEEDKALETTKPKTKIIKKKIVKKPATAASNGTTTPNKIQEKSELTKSTTSNLKQSDNNDNKLENVPRTYQIVITLSDYMGDEEEGDEDEPFGLDEGQCVEVLDNANPDAWLVRTKV
uniref:SH3 domain-containing protein n=1 Tax=Meloidogyne floridensis TaxID=298350 RepID=A0A915NPQ1_9BILA